MTEGSDKRDAERYRWLRTNAKEIVFPVRDGVSCYDPTYEKAPTLDEAIDAAITAGVKR